MLFKNISNFRNDIKSLQHEIDKLRAESQRLRSQINSAQKNLEEELRNQENQIQFKTVCETSMLPNKIISSDLKIINVNQAFVNLLGYSEKDLI